MKRHVLNYHRGDNKSVWVAELECFHSMGVEQTLSFCTDMICTQCDALQFPDGLSEVKRTIEFTSTTVPPGLLRNHTTKAGTWGQLHVLEGCVTYQPDGSPLLDIQAGEHANIPPSMPHSIRPDDAARFYVAFYTREGG